MGNPHHNLISRGVSKRCLCVQPLSSSAAEVAAEICYTVVDVPRGVARPRKMAGSNRADPRAVAAEAAKRSANTAIQSRSRFESLEADLVFVFQAKGAGCKEEAGDVATTARNGCAENGAFC